MSPTYTGLDRPPHFEVPYALTNGGQQLRHVSGHCPVHLLSVTYIKMLDLITTVLNLL